MSFDKHTFAVLLGKAIGKRSQYEYSNECGVCTAHISRLIRELVNTAPSPETIRKFASVAHNEVTYESLMMAAGHIDIFETESITRPLEGFCDMSFIDDKELIEWVKQPHNLEYVKFAYRAYSNGIPPELLDKINLVIELKK